MSTAYRALLVIIGVIGLASVVGLALYASTNDAALAGPLTFQDAMQFAAMHHMERGF